MHRLLERLDAAASTIVPLLYLAGLALGAASYFAGATLDAGLAVGVALATAAELHSFLQQRRVRAAWARLQRLPHDTPERETLSVTFKVNACILAALLAFSAYNATAFVAATWTPTPGWLPDWLQIGLRGLVIPVFFFLSGFLAPLHSDASEQLHGTSADMLRRTLRAISKQWRRRLDDARRRKTDLAPVVIALMRDAGDEASAHRVELIAAGLDATSATFTGQGVALPQPPHTIRRAHAALVDAEPPVTPAVNGAPVSVARGDDRPPTGPGSPAVASKPSDKTGSITLDVNVTPLRRGLGRAPQRDKRTAARANARSGRRGTAESRVRAALASNPDMPFDELVRRSNVSASTASKWIAVIEAERRAATQDMEQWVAQ